MSLPCGCEMPDRLCGDAQAMWDAYCASRDSQTRLLAESCTDPTNASAYNRWRLAADLSYELRRRYNRHIDGENMPPPEPQSLKADRALKVVS